MTADEILRLLQILDSAAGLLEQRNISVQRWAQLRADGSLDLSDLTALYADAQANIDAIPGEA